MRKYVLPLLLFSAIGAVIVIYVKSQGGEEPRELDPDGPGSTKTEQPETKTGKSLLERGGRDTPTKLGRNRWLSELERVLDRDDLWHAAHYIAKLCANMQDILEDPVLVRNLTAAIQKYAIDERDPEKRRLLLPILRVLTTPEATEIVQQEYYRTTDPNERLVLLDAMSNPKHNLDVAGVWAAEMAVNADDPEHRHTAFLYIRNMTPKYTPIVVRTARQIYESSTRPEQRIAAIHSITRRAEDTAEGREFLRDRLRNPRESELDAVLGFIEGWGTMRDAILLESLAARFPAMQRGLRERAEKIRTMQRMKDDPEVAKAIGAEKERAERERQKAREEREGK